VSGLTFRGRAWKVGDHVPTDQIVKSHRVLEPLEEIARHVLEDANPRFAREVRPGDVLVAGRHFGQSSGRAIAAKAIKATGVGCVVADSFSRTFYRNAFEIGLPILELDGASRAVEEGDEVVVEIESGTLRHERTGAILRGRPTDPFLLEMLRAGGVIALAPRLLGADR
jgi:3-isopropylmalate/(R)-2-methylmalate dehydratase small subunit